MEVEAVNRSWEPNKARGSVSLGLSTQLFVLLQTPEASGSRGGDGAGLSPAAARLPPSAPPSRRRRAGRSLLPTAAAPKAALGPNQGLGSSRCLNSGRVATCIHLEDGTRQH